MSLYTILGASGFIGSQFARHLLANGHTVEVPKRDQVCRGGRGHVIFSIGLTADFRTRPYATIEAHVEILRRVLEVGGFDSFTYLSSTRVYQHLPSDSVVDETAAVIVNSNDPSDLYNLSKLTGEALCLSLHNPNIRVVRLSNVYGRGDASQNFLASVLRAAVCERRVRFRSRWDAAKDYIDIQDVVIALEHLPQRGRSRLLNLASGTNITNRELGDLLRQFTGCTVETDAGADGTVFPAISIERLKVELGIKPRGLKEGLSQLLGDCSLLG